MKRVVLLLALLLCGAAQAQVGQIPNWPPATFVAAAAGYTGPCDTITCVVAYGLRAPSAATRGLKLINACNSTGGTDVGCADMLSDATTGLLVPATISGITCPGANCTIKTYYDVLAANACGGLSCDVTQATVASRHTLGTSCAPTTRSVCATSTGGFYTGTHSITISAFPVFYSSVANVVSNPSAKILIGGSAGIHGLFYFSTAGIPSIASTFDGTGTFDHSPASSANYHAFAALGNGSGAYTVADSTVTAGTVSFSSSTALMVYGGQSGSSMAAGDIILEAQMSLTAETSANAQTLDANAKTFWGF